MNLDTAVRAGQVAALIAVQEQRLAAIDLALSEQWPVSALRVRAPKEGASQPEGTEFDLLSGIEIPIADLWKIALTTARDLHSQALADLTAELEKL